MRWCAPLVALAGLLLALAARAEGGKLTLLVTGDNRGEIAPCGCAHLPAGGLARRKAVVEQSRARGPVLLLDAGNALFKGTDSDEASKARARLILETMGELRTAAMTVGPRDLSAGPGFLKSTARKANVKVLSANLTLNGKKLFEPSIVLTEGGKRVGVVGVGPAFPSLEHHPGLVGAPPVPAAVAEARKLEGKVDVVIVLAAVPLEDALQLAKEAGESVDLIFQSSDSRRPTVPRRDYSSYLITTGERGRLVASVELDLTGEGPLVDAAELSRAEQTLALLEHQLAEARQRMAAAKAPAHQQHYQESLKGFEERKAQTLARLEELRHRTDRSLLLSTTVLGPGVSGDPELEARVEKLLPPGGEQYDGPQP